ncbi:hypothetical protein BX070DRAFT_234900 [Coemansia spiralis]|nr:hypothetical protein BX070DRAFT_234900 [Coemansia spiralis]
MASIPSPGNQAENTHSSIVTDTKNINGDQTGMVGLGAVVHKHPFAPICLDEEPTHSNVFQQPCKEHGKHHLSLSTGKAVRVFIGPTDTTWMQSHQRWWVKTAGRFEEKAGSGNKIRRRPSTTEKAQDNKSDIFSMGRWHKKASALRRSSSSLSLSAMSSSSSSSTDSRSLHSQDGVDSEWSSQSDVSDIDFLETGQCNHGSTPHRNNTAVKATSHPSSPSAMKPGRSSPDPTQGAAMAPSIQFPKLVHSPLIPTPPDSAPASAYLTDVDPSERGSHHARRKSSLSAIKNIFRRNSKRKDGQAQKEAKQSQEKADTASIAYRQNLDTIPSKSPTSNTPNHAYLAAPLTRERATSLSHVPTTRELPWSPVQKAVARTSMSSISDIPKQLLLKRTAEKTRARSVTWKKPVGYGDKNTVAEDSVGETMAEAESATAASRANIPIPQADLYLQHVLEAGRHGIGGASVSSGKVRLKKAMLAKVKAYYHRHAQISETTAILATRAVVRGETASYAAFAEKYNEATSQRFRQSAQEWSEMWMVLTKRGILFYLTSKTRPTIQILFPPYTAVAPRVSLYSTLDLSIAITYYTRRLSISTLQKDQKNKSKKADGIVSEDTEAGRDNVHVAIIKFPSSQVACEWYREIGQIMMVSRVMNPQCLFSSIPPIAQPPPTSVLVNIPEIGVKVQVKLGRHNLEVPSNILLGSSEDVLLERQWRCETTTVWHVRRDVVNALLDDRVLGVQMQEWLDAERKGMLTIGMAWRRYDRLDWIMPCGSHDKQGNFYFSKVNDMVIGPQLAEGTHKLELRILQHYPDSIVVDEKRIHEPLPVEGFLMLKREKRRKADIAAYRPTLLVSHDGFLFFIHAPRAARHLQACASECSSPPARFEDDNGGCVRGSDSAKEQAIRYFHADPQTCSKQMSLAKYMLNIIEVEQIVPLSMDSEDVAPTDAGADDAWSIMDADSQSILSGQPSESDSGPLHKKTKSKVLGFLRSKKKRQAACKFKMVTKGKATIILWAPDEQCMHEWVRRLTELRMYWTNRMLLDLSVRSQVCILNYSLQGRRIRPNDMPDWNDEQSWAERSIWHACLFLGCRNIIISGILYRKRHRHQGMRKVFCILSQGRLIEYKYPHKPQAPIQTVLAEQVVHRDKRMAKIFGDGTQDGSVSAKSATESGNVVSELATKKQTAGLLLSRSRSLSLQRCYVVSRFTDDLNTRDIMCEPWVMTDIGNYSGLRLADRIYADGILSHELINDCVFTVWRPTFVPLILRPENNPENKLANENELGGLSYSSADEQIVNSAAASKSPSPNSPNSPAKRRPSVSFSPPANISEQLSVPAIHIGNVQNGSHQRKGSGDTTSRTSNDALRISGDGYLSSVSNASSNMSSTRMQQGPGKPGAYRVGDKIHVNVDDKDEGTKRMNAMAMMSSMRRRVGVYKARTNAEMEQWVTAINQEIRRMSLSAEW